MKTATKVHVLLAYSVLAGLWYLLDPDSSLLSVPFAIVIAKILDPMMQISLVGNVLLVPAGNALTAPYVVRFIDVCVGLFLLVSSALFLWLRSASKTVIISTVVGQFLINTFRVILVILVLRTYGYTVAAFTHDIFYAAFTALAIAVIAYGVHGGYLQLTAEPERNAAKNFDIRSKRKLRSQRRRPVHLEGTPGLLQPEGLLPTRKTSGSFPGKVRSWV